MTASVWPLVSAAVPVRCLAVVCNPVAAEAVWPTSSPALASKSRITPDRRSMRAALCCAVRSFLLF